MGFQGEGKREGEKGDEYSKWKGQRRKGERKRQGRGERREGKGNGKEEKGEAP